MFITYTKQNKFGGYTHEIEFTTILVIRLTEMDPKTIQGEFLEKRLLINNKVFFTFISHGSLTDAVSKAFGMMLYPPKPLPIERDLGAINRFKEDVLNFMLDHRKNINQVSIVKF